MPVSGGLAKDMLLIKQSNPTEGVVEQTSFDSIESQEMKCQKEDAEMSLGTFKEGPDSSNNFERESRLINPQHSQTIC